MSVSTLAWYAGMFVAGGLCVSPALFVISAPEKRIVEHPIIKDPPRPPLPPGGTGGNGGKPGSGRKPGGNTHEPKLTEPQELPETPPSGEYDPGPEELPPPSQNVRSRFPFAPPHWRNQPPTALAASLKYWNKKLVRCEADSPKSYMFVNDPGGAYYIEFVNPEHVVDTVPMSGEEAQNGGMGWKGVSYLRAKNYSILRADGTRVPQGPLRGEPWGPMAIMLANQFGMWITIPFEKDSPLRHATARAAICDQVATPSYGEKILQ